MPQKIFWKAQLICLWKPVIGLLTTFLYLYKQLSNINDMGMSAIIALSEESGSVSQG